MEVSNKKPEHPSHHEPRVKCPFLVRIFYSLNNENDLELFKDPSKLPVEREIQLHLWLDSTLRDICELIKAQLPTARDKQRFKFSKVACDQKDAWQKKQLGSVFLHKRGERIDNRTLDEGEFRIGDYLDVSINYK